MRLNPAAFNSHLNHIGQQFMWRKSFRCPCVNPNSGAAKPGCPVCSGKGSIWNPAVAAVAGMAGQKIQQRWQQMGQWQDGDAVVTIGSDSPMYEMGKYDRVLMLNSTDYFSLVLTHGGPQEKIHEPVEKIKRVFWLKPDGSGIFEGGIPTVNADGTLAWNNTYPLYANGIYPTDGSQVANGTTNGEPPIGVQYSITGTRFSEYFIWDQFPSDRNEHSGARLPKRVVLRRFDLFGRDL